jgi:general secretion pathway protein E
MSWLSRVRNIPGPVPQPVAHPPMSPATVAALTSRSARAQPPERAPMSATSSGMLPCVEKAVGDFTVRVAHERLGSEVSIAGAVSFVRTLGSEINLAAGLYSQICPVEVAANTKKVAILCTEKMADSEEMVEVLRSLARKNFIMADGLQPNFFICVVEALVLSVSKGHLTGEDVAKRKRVLGKSSEGALWRNFLDIVTWGVRNKASDIHFNIESLSDRSQIKFTIDGQYVAPEMYNIPTTLLSQMAGVAYQQSKGGNGSDFQPLIEQQCRIFAEVTAGDQSERVMLRWASMATDDGPQITLRILLLDAQIHTHTLESLGYMPSQVAMIRRAMMSEGGAIVASGVLGSGKSTLLATLLSAVSPLRKVMTFEDPREYIIPRAHQNTIARSLDTEDDNAYLAKIRTLKRTAFNDLMIGEIRDRQTGQAFQDVVESGPNVYTTVHARRHIGIPDRLASPFIGVDRAVLSTPGILKLLIAQVLLPVNCSSCSIPAAEVLSGATSVDGLDASWLAVYFGRITKLFGLPTDGIRLRNSRGCEHCLRPGLAELAGYRGRTVAAEMIEPDETFLTFVRDAQNIELKRYVSSMPHTALTDPDATGKSALQVALYHMHCGRLDPRAIEHRFESFETMDLRRQARGHLNATLKKVA